MGKKKDEAKPQEQELPPELKALKERIDTFTKAAVEKFEKYILGVALLPPDQKNKEKVNLLVIVDDSDSQRMSKEELKSKLGTIIVELATKTDPNFAVDTWILSELWADCHDGKYDKLKILATAQPFMDKGVIEACKISEVHKQMVIEKFERYIVCYVAAGAMFRGEGNPKSDIDVFMVIDDTDVKKMSRGELKDKLTSIVYDLAFRAADMTGIKRKLHVQTYLLTDFWDSIKDANPVIFTFLRDGIPFFDRGMYMPWKQLLKMGKIKPSAESIDMFQNSGEQFLERAKKKFLMAGVEDAYYAILNPSQAALMMYGINPATPRETARLIREIFVEKEKILEKEYADIIEEQVKIWKKFEYEEITEMDGATADRLIKNVEKYLKRIKQLYEQVEKQKTQESISHATDSVISCARDVLKMEGIEKIATEQLQKTFEKQLVHAGVFGEETGKTLSKLLSAKKEYDKGKLTKPELEKLKTDTRRFIQEMVDYMEHKRAKDLAKAKLLVRYADKTAEVILFEDTAYVVHDTAKKDKITKAQYSPAKGMSKLEESSLEDLEKSFANSKFTQKIHLHAKTFEELSVLLGSPVEVLVGH